MPTCCWQTVSRPGCVLVIIEACSAATPAAAPPPTPEARRRVQRLEEARQDVEAFDPRNIYQDELRTLLLAMIDHVRVDGLRAYGTLADQADVSPDSKPSVKTSPGSSMQISRLQPSS